MNITHTRKAVGAAITGAAAAGIAFPRCENRAGNTGCQ